MIYAVGDIHGDSDRLSLLIAQLPLTPNDTIVFVGDYIDRGPDSSLVIDFLLRLQKVHPRCVFLQGNHEEMMLTLRARMDPQWSDYTPKSSPEWEADWLENGGDATLRSYGAGGRALEDWWASVSEDHWRFLVDTKLEHRTEDYRFVHAGFIPPGTAWAYEKFLEPRLWIRDPFLNSLADFGGLVVFGHTPQRSGRPLVMVNKIGIDTGAAYGGPLTAVALSGLEQEPIFYQV